MTLDQTEHFVALAVQKLGKVLAVLTGDTSDEGAWHSTKATHTLNDMNVACDVAVIAGGVGAARFLRALQLMDADCAVVAIVNTGDDAVVNGLHVSPDIDTVIYTLADAIDPGRGWGLRDETWTTMQSHQRYRDTRPAGSAAPNNWFNLGDRDMATHLYRTARLAEGASLHDTTQEIAKAWGVRYDIVPMSDARVETRLTLAEEVTSPDGHTYRSGATISFQEYFVRLRHAVAIDALQFVGANTAVPNRLDLLSTAGTVVIAPSNPLVSIGPVRALRGVDAALSARRDSVVAISPIIGGAALKGPADRMLREMGHEATALGVARLYAEICGVFIIDEIDADLSSDIERLGMRCIVTRTIMKSDDTARALAATALKAGAR